MLKNVRLWDVRLYSAFSPVSNEVGEFSFSELIGLIEVRLFIYKSSCSKVISTMTSESDFEYLTKSHIFILVILVYERFRDRW